MSKYPSLNYDALDDFYTVKQAAKLLHTTGAVDKVDFLKIAIFKSFEKRTFPLSCCHNQDTKVRSIFQNRTLSTAPQPDLKFSGLATNLESALGQARMEK